jgi:hypothetical protein
MGSKTVKDGETIEQLIEEPKATVAFSRKVTDGNYGSSEFSVFVQANVPERTGDKAKDTTALAEAIREAAAVAKTQVFQQLGLSYEVDAVNLVVVEQLEKTLGAKVVEGEKPKAPVARKAQPKRAAPTNGYRQYTNEEYEAAWADIQANPRGWWDNRQNKRNPKAPDFKPKDDNGNVAEGIALWLNRAPDGFEYTAADTSA